MKTTTKIVTAIGVAGIGAGAMIILAPEFCMAAAIGVGGRLLLSLAGKALAKRESPRIIASVAGSVLGKHGASAGQILTGSVR
jgi:hypothetical protein